MLCKIINRFYILKAACLFLLTIMLIEANAQENSYTRPTLTDKYSEYKKQVWKDPTKKMIELKSILPDLVYDLRYATINNFMKRLMYPANTEITFLRLPAANALQKVQSALKEKGLGLKIYDSYRPWSVTAKFWELVHDDRYVANPSKGSGHNRGISIDLTIINLSTGQELYMGTGFDNFSDTAHHAFTKLPEDILQNRLLLKSTMEKYGFIAYENEWWHYSWPGPAKFEILDIDFKKLKKEL